MRFLHTADLHIGKRVNEFSMLEDQEYILRQILKTADKEQVEAVLIAGDVYDKQVPSAEAVRGSRKSQLITRIIRQPAT